MIYKLIKEYPGSPKLGFTIENGYYCDQLYINPKDFPENWKLVIEKDYEILSLKNKAGTIINSATIQKEFTPETLYLKATTTICKYRSDEFIIHSVKRLSDGEIFTIGDKCKNGIITSFEQVNQGCPFSAKYNNGCQHDYINYLIKVKQPLFTTEDGVDIFEGDIYYYFRKHSFTFDKAKTYTGFYEADKHSNNSLYFSTKEKAEEYIIINKPCLSLNDIEFAISKTNNAKEKRNKLRDLVKSKIKQSV